MNQDIAIQVQVLSKCYQIYDNPSDRLKQFVLPRLKRLFGNIGKPYFREFWALRDVSFEVKRGETVGIIGRNGSGKSTLLQIICGTLSPSAGEVQVNGRVAALLELGSGFNPEFTGRENVYLNAAVLGLNKDEIDARFDQIIAFADIGEFIDRPVKMYSSGMMLRLAFAVIAHVDADILIIDEALAVGDAFFTQKCMRFLRDFMKNGTILFVSHDTASIKNLCSYAVWLEKGKVLQQGSPKEVCELYLEAFYEEQQGKSSVTKLKNNSQETNVLPVRLKDQRLEFINASNLRNDIQIFKFEPEAASFGNGAASIQNVTLFDKEGQPLSWVVGGEQVSLSIGIKVNQTFQSPIVGFHVKDRLGQILFGDNTFLTYQNSFVECHADENLEAKFAFNMPILPIGDYSVTVAVASGVRDAHIQHHWIHDAIHFKSESSSTATGLIGIPMLAITLNQIESL